MKSQLVIILSTLLYFCAAAPVDEKQPVNHELSEVLETSHSALAKRGVDIIIPNFAVICRQKSLLFFDFGLSQCTGATTFNVHCTEAANHAIRVTPSQCPTDYYCEDTDGTGHVNENNKKKVRCVHQDYRALLNRGPQSDEVASPSYCPDPSLYKQFLARMESYDSLRKGVFMRFMKTTNAGKTWEEVGRKHPSSSELDFQLSYDLNGHYTCFKAFFASLYPTSAILRVTYAR